MPSEQTYPASNDQTQQDHIQGQVKLCLYCHGSLSSDTTNSAFFDHNDATIVCTTCQDQSSLDRPRLGEPYGFCDLAEDDSRRSSVDQNPDHVLTSHIGTHVADDRVDDNDVDMESEPASPALPHAMSPSAATAFRRSPTSTGNNKHLALRIVCDAHQSFSSTSKSRQYETSAMEASTSCHRQHSYAASSPDPLVDITRLRVRSKGHHCLYPGATFEGTQKSGRNSYDVNVTIVDVDFSTSFLCGYLRIRGLTDDWPELTTYFDAEIIGSRHGFLTQNWGANEQEDMVHWQRFPAFRHVKHELKKPHLTMSDRDRGAVFMRWKERFLVPDHRVQDINGASFAGFYYVCVDFNPQPAAPPVRAATQLIPLTPESDECDLPFSAPPKIESPRIRRGSSARRGVRAPSLGPRSGNPVPTMSGFYFHQNSEPYQQLSLDHVPERTSSSFEFR